MDADPSVGDLQSYGKGQKVWHLECLLVTDMIGSEITVGEQESWAGSLGNIGASDV